MGRYVIKRLLYGLLVLLGVVTLVFFLFNILPGDPARMMLGQRADQESIDIINRDLGRDKPVALQYLNYLNDLVPVSVHNNSDSTSYFCGWGLLQWCLRLLTCGAATRVSVA